LIFLNAYPVNKPEVMIGQAQTKFDEAGNLTDEATREFIRTLLASLVAWTERLKASSPTS
jgi:chromate reductase